MVKHDAIDGSTETVLLEPPHQLESRLVPMFMCCGHWSYGFSFGISGPSVTITWVEDGSAACNN